MKLLEAYAAASTAFTSDVYPTDLELFDYYSDCNLGSTRQNNLNSDAGQGNRSSGFQIFNQALYFTGYATKAGTATDYSNQALKYFPLYVGLQYSDQSSDSNASSETSFRYNLMMKAAIAGNNYFNYCFPANSSAQNNDAIKSATQGLVDRTLRNGEITQGNGLVKLPYFDKDFLDRTVGQSVDTSAPSPYTPNLYSASTANTLGRYTSGKFVFKKASDGDDEGMYIYDSVHHGLSYTAKSGDDPFTMTVEPKSLFRLSACAYRAVRFCAR